MPIFLFVFLEMEIKFQPKRRKFLVLTTTALAGVGCFVGALPFISSMNPSKDIIASSTKEVSLSAIEAGQVVKVMFRGKPIFIRHRTDEEIKRAEETSIKNLKDPQTDEQRVKPGKARWLIVEGVCTHLGCIPIANQGDYGGWFCPCHGSHYDVSGRIMQGPAPKNLIVPDYYFVNDELIVLGQNVAS